MSAPLEGLRVIDFSRVLAARTAPRRFEIWAPR